MRTEAVVGALRRPRPIGEVTPDRGCWRCWAVIEFSDLIFAVDSGGAAGNEGFSLSERRVVRRKKPSTWRARGRGWAKIRLGGALANLDGNPIAGRRARRVSGRRWMIRALGRSRRG
jgi:hypothetical protein